MIIEVTYLYRFNCLIHKNLSYFSKIVTPYEILLKCVSHKIVHISKQFSFIAQLLFN